jgi:flagellar biosynthesis/type III secretory pathway protein FliH
VMIDNELRVQGMTNRAMEALESTVKQTCYNAYKQGWAEGHEEGYTAGYTAGKLDAPDRNVSS